MGQLPAIMLSDAAFCGMLRDSNRMSEIELQIAFRNLEHRFRGVSGPRRPLAAPARLPKLPGASPDVMTAWVTHSHALKVF